MLVAQSVTEHRSVNSLSSQVKQLQNKIVMFMNYNHEL